MRCNHEMATQNACLSNRELMHVVMTLMTRGSMPDVSQFHGTHHQERSPKGYVISSRFTGHLSMDVNSQCPHVLIYRNPSWLVPGYTM